MTAEPQNQADIPGHSPSKAAAKPAPGGLERCVAHLVNGLDSAKFVPSVISFGMLTEVPDWIDRDDVTISSLQKKRGNDIGLIYRLVRMFRRDKIDLAQ